MKEIEDTTAKAQMSKNTHLHTHTKKGCWEQVTAPYGIFAARIKMHSLNSVCVCVHTVVCVYVCVRVSVLVQVCIHPCVSVSLHFLCAVCFSTVCVCSRVCVCVRA